MRSKSHESSVNIFTFDKLFKAPESDSPGPDSAPSRWILRVKVHYELLSIMAFLSGFSFSC